LYYFQLNNFIYNSLNTNVDLILSGAKLLKKLNLNSNVEPKNHITIDNLNEFKENFMFYFGKGSAAERSFTNLDDFNKVLEATEDIKKQVRKHPLILGLK
jgi:hypothetical protein